MDNKKKPEEAKIQDQQSCSQSELDGLLCAFASLIGCIESSANTTHKFSIGSEMQRVTKTITKTLQFSDAKRLLLKLTNFKEST